MWNSTGNKLNKEIARDNFYQMKIKKTCITII